MINNLEAVQRLGQQNVETAIKMFGEWNKGWRSISAEMTDFTKQSFEDCFATAEKLLAVFHERKDGARIFRCRSGATVCIAVWPGREAHRFLGRLRRNGVKWLHLSDEEIAKSKELRHARVHRRLRGGDHHRHSRWCCTRSAGARIVFEVLFHVCRPTLDRNAGTNKS